MTTELAPEAAPAQEWPCSIDEYHADGRNSVSHSELDLFIESPRLYHGRIITGEYPREETAALDFGQVFHDVVLGERVFDRENFNRGTIAIWEPCESPSPTDDKFMRADFVSDSGSRYWFYENGVVRMSDHWGEVGGCYWAFKGEVAGKPVCGVCSWDDFFSLQSFTPIPRRVLNAQGHKKGSAWTEFADAHADEILLKEDEFETIVHMLDSIRIHGAARELLFDLKGKNEYSIRWKCQHTGIKRRARLDRVIPGLIIDLKSLADVSAKEFAAHAYRYGYHRQVAFYQDAILALRGRVLRFVFVCVQKTPPYTCEVYELDSEFVNLGGDENRDALRRLAGCRDSGVFQSPSHGTIVTLSAPTWALNERHWHYGD